MGHGNSYENDKPHHLYAILDEEEKDVFKYGISDNLIDERDSSDRMREQVNYLNRAVGWIRFIAVILIRNIQGRLKARELEEKHIADYQQEKGRRSRGNP